jgi:hypothetical protein
VRKIVAKTFATLISLMPLESGVPDPEGMSDALKEQKRTQRSFLEQLMDPSKLEHYAIPVSIKAELRSYQQAGIDWMNFLRKYKLHGILCDDMGLGKTLQVCDEENVNPSSGEVGEAGVKGKPYASGALCSCAGRNAVVPRLSSALIVFTWTTFVWSLSISNSICSRRAFASSLPTTMSGEQNTRPKSRPTRSPCLPSLCALRH